MSEYSQEPQVYYVINLVFCKLKYHLLYNQLHSYLIDARMQHHDIRLTHIGSTGQSVDRTKYQQDIEPT